MVKFLFRLYWWLSGKEFTCQCRSCRLDPWVGKIPWRKAWQPIPVFLPGESQGQRSLVGYSPWGHKRVGHNWVTEHVCMPQLDSMSWRIKTLICKQFQDEVSRWTSWWSCGWDFAFQCMGCTGSIPGQGTKIPHASWPKEPEHKQQKQYCNKLIKTL